MDGPHSEGFDKPIDIFKAKPNAEYLECQGSGLWNEVLFANIVAMVLLD